MNFFCDSVEQRTDCDAEVVLAVLIESFRFSPSKKEIFWQMNGIASPVVLDSEEGHHQLPLVVELAA